MAKDCSNTLCLVKLTFLNVHTTQEGVAIEIAEAVIGALKGELSSTAVNAPMVPAEVYSAAIYSFASLF